MSLKLTRRQFVVSAAAGLGGAWLAACAPKPQPTAAPKVEAKPAEKATAPAAAKPAEKAKVHPALHGTRWATGRLYALCQPRV